MHESYRMPRIVIDPETLAAHRKKVNRALRIGILLAALVIALGLLELVHRGTTAFILSLLQAAVLAVWDMVCSIAAACREFMEYVNRQRS